MEFVVRYFFDVLLGYGEQLYSQLDNPVRINQAELKLAVKICELHLKTKDTRWSMARQAMLARMLDIELKPPMLVKIHRLESPRPIRSHRGPGLRQDLNAMISGLRGSIPGGHRSTRSNLVIDPRRTNIEKHGLTACALSWSSTTQSTAKTTTIANIPYLTYQQQSDIDNNTKTGSKATTENLKDKHRDAPLMPP